MPDSSADDRRTSCRHICIDCGIDTREIGEEYVLQQPVWLRATRGLVIADWVRHYSCTWDSRGYGCDGGQVRKLASGELVVGESCPSCKGIGFHEYNDPPLVPASYTIQGLLAEHFGIDQKKVDLEQRAMLAALREA